jgi:hypothetical protein
MKQQVIKAEKALQEEEDKENANGEPVNVRAEVDDIVNGALNSFSSVTFTGNDVMVQNI